MKSENKLSGGRGREGVDVLIKKFSSLFTDEGTHTLSLVNIFYLLTSIYRKIRELTLFFMHI